MVWGRFLKVVHWFSWVFVICCFLVGDTFCFFVFLWSSFSFAFFQFVQSSCKFFLRALGCSPLRFWNAIFVRSKYRVFCF